MNKLQCEMCGSTDILKSDGVFTCQVCGIKYTADEIKKMMVAGTVDVKGTVKIDNTDNIQKFLLMAKNACDSENMEEAEEYANKLIEIDPENAEGWLLKGISAGWQSSIADLRLNEAMNCFVNAVNYTKDQDGGSAEKEIMVGCVYDEFLSLAKGVIRLKSGHFVKWHDKETADELNKLFRDMSDMISELASSLGALPDGYNVMTDFVCPLAEICNEAVDGAWRNVEAEYKAEQFPDRYDFEKFIENGDACLSALLPLFACYDKNDADSMRKAADRINFYIEIQNKIIKGCAWTEKYIDYKRDMPGGEASVISMLRSKGHVPNPKNNTYWCREFTLTDSAVASRKKSIDQCNKELEEINKKIYEKYWADHAEEKLRLETELGSLKEEKKQVSSQIDNVENNELRSVESEFNKPVPSEKTKENLQDQIYELNDKMSSLGIFKGKEKKSLREQIDELERRMAEVKILIDKEKNERKKYRDEKVQEIENRIKPQKTRLAEIERRISEIEKIFAEKRC